MKNSKRLISLVLVVVMLFSFIPATAMDVIAADAAHSVDAATAANRTNTLINNLAGKYFTTTQSTCGNSKCDTCKNSNIIGTTWLKNTMGLVPDSVSLLPEHYYSSSGIVTSTAWSCAGFANYCLWYIYAKNPSDNVRRVNIYSGAYNKSNMDNSGVRTGDVIRVADRHSFIYISHDSSGVTVLDSNWDSATPNLVKKHVISWSWRSGTTMAITRGKNWTGQHTHSFTGQRLQEAAHPHEISQRCVDYATCGGFIWTGEYGASKTCSKCWNGSFTVSSSSVNVKVGNTQTVNISLSGFFPDSAVLHIDYNDSIVSVTSSGQSFTFKGLKKGSCNYVISVYSDSSKKTLICTKTISVTVEEASVTKVVSSLPSKTSYYIGDSFDSSGIKLTVTYSDGSTKTITSGYTVSGFSSSTEGTKTVTVSYGGKSTTFTIKVLKPSITINTSGKTLKIGESFTVNATTTPTGQAVAWKTGNANVATVSNGKITAVGEGTVSIYANFTYNGIKYETKMSITVEKPETIINSISVKSLPNKTLYYIGDSINVDGLAITAKYSDGSAKTITTDFTVSGFNSSSKGTKTVTVSYGGKTTSFDVTVKSPSVIIALDSKALTVGDVYTLSATAEPDNTDLMWSSSDANIATVSNGKVTAKSEGEVIIKAKLVYNGITYSDTCTIRVTDIGCKHKYTHVYEAVDSTCTTQGHGKYIVCDDCKIIISGTDEKLPLLDHTPGEYTVTREPTYNVVGIEACFCTECGKQLDRRQIPILEYQNKFTDVKSSHWFWESVNYVARKGYMSGMSETKFSPLTELTREQFIQILFAMEGKDKADYIGTTGFIDVSEGKWYSPAIKWAKQEKITEGVGNGKFGLGANITREQMAKFMMSFAQYRGYNTDIRGDISIYKDVNKIASWAKEAMQWCVGIGIYESTSTTQKTLEPRLTVKRAVAATVIMRFVQNTGK